MNHSPSRQPDRQPEPSDSARPVDSSDLDVDRLGFDDPVSRMALYFAGALSDVEQAEIDRLLGEGDQSLREAFRSLQDGVVALSGRAPSIEPPLHVRSRLMRAIQAGDTEPTPSPHAAGGSGAGDRSSSKPRGSDIWKGWESDSAEDGLFTLFAGEGDWESTGVPGVDVRRLFVDRTANRMTAMFRMAAGTEYPEHQHDGHEECFVLDGELHVGDEIVMRRGDYQRAESGSPHARQWTERGCLLLVSTSLSDTLR